MASITCPTCGYLVPAEADFCPNCGRPRTAVQQRLEQESRATGIPYIRLLERARAEAGVFVPSNTALVQIQAQLRLLDDLVRGIDRRIREIEERVPGIDVAPPLTALPGVSDVAPPAEPARPTEPQPAGPEPPVWEEPVEPAAEPVEPDAIAPLPGPAHEAAQETPSEAEQLWGPGTRQPDSAEPEEPAETAPEPEPVPAQLAARRAREQPDLIESLRRDLPNVENIDLEDLLSGRVLAWTGGAAILLGAIFFLSLAFSRGWIGPTARVTIGITAAAAMIAAGAWFFERRERIFGHVMVAIGLGVMNIALFAATRLYDLMPAQPALLGVLGTAAVAAVIAIRSSSQIVAIYGLVAALVAPPLLGADPTLGTAAFVGVILIGTTVIALYRSWTWLPPVAFFLSAPQAVAFFTGDVNVAVGLIALAFFWSLYAVSAGGEEFRVRRRELGITSATLLLLDALFLVTMGFALLDGDNEQWRGLFLVGVAAAHGVLGGYFLRDRGDRNPFGMLAFGTGIAAFSMAVPIQLGGPPVPIGWAAEAVALTWVYSQRRHIYAGAYAAVLGVLAIGHLLVFEYPIDRIADDLESARPFLNGNGLTLAFLLGALAVAGSFISSREIRAGLTVLGLFLVIVAMPYETSGVRLVAGWSLVFLAGLGLQHWEALEEDERFPSWQALYLPAMTAALLAVFHMLAFELPLSEVSAADLPDTPFTDVGTLTTLILIAAAAAASFITRHEPVTHGARIASFAFAAYLMPFEISTPAVVVAWAALAVGPMLLARHEPGYLLEYLTAAGTLLGGGLLVVLFSVAPASRMFSGDGIVASDPPFWSSATAALGALIAVLVLASWLFREHPELAIGSRVIALLLAGYLMPFELSEATAVVAWSLLAIGLTQLSRSDRRGMHAYLVTAASLAGLGLLVTLASIAPPNRLVVRAGSSIDHPLLWSGATLALGALIVALAFAAWVHRERREIVIWVGVLAGALGVYLLSVGVVDAFQSRVDEGTSLRSLQKQAQVALSILWAVLGGGAFIAGILRFAAPVRLFGLALLALATVKVFIVDLASLDASYRVLSFIGLGILLLVSSYIYQHYRSRPARDEPRETPSGAA